MQEMWAHRADLAEQAINDRHASRVWGIPGTNLCVVCWPPTTKDKVFLRWHYWWQAHYLDCLIDAANRRGTRARKRLIRHTIAGIRLRSVAPLTRNRYYDDKAWLALALSRAGSIRRLRSPRRLRDLEFNILEGVDSLTGVLPWRRGETFYNVPTNGPAAIMMARTGRLDQAISVTDWAFDNLINDEGLVMDGIRMRMHGPETVTNIYPYNQGLMIGACLEIAEKLRERTGWTEDHAIASAADAEEADQAVHYTALLRDLVQATARELATPKGVIDCRTLGGDGGLFKGILVRYLADAAVRLPADNPLNRATRKVAARLVLASAESVWNHRLEVDGLPVFGSDWTSDARLPRNSSAVGEDVAGAVNSSQIPERDLSVQLSGWMLMEAAARVAAARRSE